MANPVMSVDETAMTPIGKTPFGGDRMIAGEMYNRVSPSVNAAQNLSGMMAGWELPRALDHAEHWVKSAAGERSWVGREFPPTIDLVTAHPYFLDAELVQELNEWCDKYDLFWEADGTSWYAEGSAVRVMVTRK